MKFIAVALLSTGSILTAVESANAQVAYRFIKSGSAVLGYASNGTDRAYNCSGVVTVGYDDYGTRKTSTQNVNYTVRAGLNDGVVYQWQTPWPGSSMTVNYSHSGCT
jgi:hypothetical protein